MLTSSEDYFCAKGLQVNSLKFLHLNKSVGGGGLHDFILRPFCSSFKNCFSIQGRYMGYTKLNIHYIFTVPLLKRDFFFLFTDSRETAKGE